MSTQNKSYFSHKLIQLGVVLFLIGLLTGFTMPLLQNQRMGLSSHLEGIQNGIFLMIFGLIWERIELSEKYLKWSFNLAIYGTYTNWLTTFLAALWGAGSEMMPIAGQSMKGTILQEVMIKFGLVSLSISMIVVCIFIILGLKKQTR